MKNRAFSRGFEGELRDRAMDLEAFYVATGLRVLTYAFSPERIVVGGGVGLAPGLLPRLRTHLGSALADYPGLEPDDLRACLAYAHAAISHDKLDSLQVPA